MPEYAIAYVLLISWGKNGKGLLLPVCLIPGLLLLQWKVGYDNKRAALSHSLDPWKIKVQTLGQSLWISLAGTYVGIPRSKKD